MTVTRDNYQLTVVSMLAWNRKVSDMIHGRYHLFCSRHAINLYGGVAMLDFLMQSCTCFPPHLHEVIFLFCKIRLESFSFNPKLRLQNIVVHD